MFKQVLLILLLLAIIHPVNLFAADKQPDAVRITKPLDLSIDHDLIMRPEKRQKTIVKKNDQLLPNIFKNQIEDNISVDGGVLINDESANSKVFDGAEISIKLNTD